jgi:hypothetical protein
VVMAAIERASDAWRDFLTFSGAPLVKFQDIKGNR